MGGHNLELFLITEKQSWCAPIMCHNKGTKITEDRKNRYVHIIHKEILVLNMSTRDSGKVLDILK